MTYDVRLPDNHMHQALLRKFVALRGELLIGRAPVKGSTVAGIPPDSWVSDWHRLHDLIRGFYKPKRWSYVLSILLTEKPENYGQEIKWQDYDEGLFRSISYHAPSRLGDNRSRSDTAAARKNHVEQMPVGLLHNRGASRNLILGIGLITREEDGVFHIQPAELPVSESTRAIVETEKALSDAIEGGDYSAPEKLTTIRARVGQNKFRQMVMTRFGYHCAFCGFDDEDMLVAGHIVRWADDPAHRLNPENGILLCALCDKAFELGKIKLTADLRIVASSLNNAISDSHQRWRKSLFDRVTAISPSILLEDLLCRAGKLSM